MIYICGDLHATYGPTEEEKFIKSLSSKDILIVAGDFGWTWNKAIQSKFCLDCTTLFIDGNHENFELIKDLPDTKMYGDTVKVFNDNTFYLKRGHLYTIEGKTFFCFGGANSIDKDWRIPYRSWWPEEIPNQSEFNTACNTLKDCNYKFDYFLTHTCADKEEIDMLHYAQRIKDPTTNMITALEDLIINNGGEYKLHFFGHHHKFGQMNKHIMLYQQVYCLDKNEFKYF